MFKRAMSEFTKCYQTHHFSFIFPFHSGEDLYALVVIAMFIDKKNISK